MLNFFTFNLIEWEVLHIIDIFSYSRNPADQFISKGEEKCYFFTPTYRKSLNGSRPNRTTSNGYWRASTAVTPIEDERNNEIGTKRSLVFHFGDHPHGRKSNWIMHEYKLIENQSTTHVQIPTDPMKVYTHYTIP